MPVVIGHRGTHDFRSREAVDLGFGDEPRLQQFFADRDAFRDRVNAELAGAVIADPLDHGGDECRGGGDACAAFVDVGLDAVDAFVRHHEAGFLEHFESVQKAIRDEGEERIEFEISLADGVGDGRIVSNDEHARLDHGFGDDGVDFSGHDGASGLTRREGDLADAGLGPRGHEAQVGGDFEKRGRACLEDAADVREIVEVLRAVDEVVRLHEVDAGLFRQGRDDIFDVFVGSADAGADGGAAEVDGSEGLEPACGADEVAGEGFGIRLEFKAQRGQDGILELGAPDFDDVVHAGSRLTQGEFERLQGGQEILDLTMEGDAEGRRADVVRGLLIVDVVERRDA